MNSRGISHLFITPVVDAKLDALANFLLVLTVELSVELLDEDDDLVDFVVFQISKFRDKIAADFLAETDASVVELIEFWVGGAGIEDVGGDVGDDAF